jgi:hypothetical protein
VKSFLKLGELPLHSLLNLLDLGDDVEAAVDIFKPLVNHTSEVFALLARVSLEGLGLLCELLSQVVFCHKPPELLVEVLFREVGHLGRLIVLVW